MDIELSQLLHWYMAIFDVFILNEYFPISNPNIFTISWLNYNTHVPLNWGRKPERRNDALDKQLTNWSAVVAHCQVHPGSTQDTWRAEMHLFLHSVRIQLRRTCLSVSVCRCTCVLVIFHEKTEWQSSSWVGWLSFSLARLNAAAEAAGGGVSTNAF